MTDQELIRLYQTRDPRAVEETRAKYGAYCGTIARRLLTDERDVEECLSDCAMAVWNAIPPACPEHFKGWLGAVVRHRALAIGRANGRRPPTVEESALELAACLAEGDTPTGSWRPGNWGRPSPAFSFCRSRRCARPFCGGTGMPKAWRRWPPIWAGACPGPRACSSGPESGWKPI